MRTPGSERPRRLPVAVPLVRDEMIDSYLRRVAGANHLDTRDLTSYLDAPAGARGPHRFERLAAMTGHHIDRLRDMLATAVHPRHQHQREACHRCTARRGIHTSVQLVAPTYITTCPRHRRWLPAGYYPSGAQYDLADLPEILTAQRRHLQLIREHGIDEAAGFVSYSRHITDRWTHRRDWAQHRERRLSRFLDPTTTWVSQAHPLIEMVNYPETVALARIFATPRWTEQAISTDPRRRNGLLRRSQPPARHHLPALHRP